MQITLKFKKKEIKLKRIFRPTSNMQYTSGNSIVTLTFFLQRKTF